MKSKSSTYIIVVVVLVVLAIIIYFVASKSSGNATSSTTPGLVSTNAGTTGVPTSSGTVANAIPTSATTAGSPGSQVVALLRNLSAIQLDDTVFTNPSFGLLQDLSVQLPQITSQGRRNPFAPVGASDSGSATTVTNGATGVTFQVPTSTH